MLKLKKLEVFGFKSFADKADLAFPGSGIASIVGPNGCGKSNISDSISWVLGEQSAKTLRGSRMEDVIFNGSQNRKPGGLATVSLTLVDPDGSRQELLNGINGYGHANGVNGHGGSGRPSEITVTRKLFRSGESHYMMNGKNVRLRDIQSLFMGTGLGPNHYAIIEQGRIGQVLSSRPLDRRGLIEEAAGVTKFKSRKRLAELKLESARQNLARVNDILQEVTRQASSLKRQAARAKRYAEYRERLSSALSALLASRQRKMAAEIAAAQQLMDGADAEYKRQAADAQQLESELTEKRAEQQRVETELEVSRTEAARLTVEVERLRSRIEQQARMVQENENRKSQAEAEIVSLEERLSELAAELEAERQAAEAVERQSEQVSERLAEKSRRIEARREAFERRAQEQEAARKRVITLLNEASQLRNQMAKIEEFLAGNERSLTRAREEEAAARRQVEKIQSERTEIEAKAAASRAELETARQRGQQIDQTIQSLREEGKRARAAADELQGELSRLRARRESLEEILSHHAYTTESVKKLFAAIESGAGGDLKPIGILADIVEVEPRYERLAEEFLREELEYIVVEGWGQARAGISLMRGGVEGRATFLVHPDRPEQSDSPALGPEAGVTGRLADHVQLQNGLADSASTLLPKLRNCYLVGDDETARKLAVRNPDLYFLLPDGQCYRGYTVSGGGKSGAGPLALKRELRELRPRLAEAEKEFEANRKAAEEAEVQTGIRTVEREKLQVEIQGLEKTAVGMEHQLRQLEEDSRREQRRASVAGDEAGRMEADAKRATAECDEAKGAIDQRERDRQSAEEQLETLRAELEDDQQSLRTLSEEQTGLRTESATLEERRRALNASLERMRRLLQEQQQRREHIQDQIGTWETENSRLLEDNERHSTTIEANDKRQQELAAAVARLAKNLECLRSGNIEREQRMNTLRSEVEETRQRRSKVELELVQLRSDLKHLAEMCERELSRPLDEVAAEAPENLSAEQLAEAEERYHEIKQKIENLGPVNVLALEEFEEYAKRQQFLETQQSDLLDSIRDTQQAIHEIDNASKKRFQEAFEAINRNFTKAFTGLFGGGVGEMRLSDPENPGESGVDIVASPPGKRLQNVLLLSGGEKSLTALALLMATFQFRPSPFCVLDEVDAALDEPNIMRFKRLLEQMGDQTQFIVITHAKTTMQAAQSLYGVTMQEPGVSTLVSVRMADHQRSGRSDERVAETVKA